MSLKRKARRALFVMFSLTLTLSILTTMVPDTLPFGESTVSGCCLMFASVWFFLYINWAMVKGRTRNDLLLCSFLMILFVLLRCSRYISFLELNHMQRFVWYLYYIPCLLLPYLSFDAAMFIGRPDDAPAMAWEWIPCIISSIFIVLVCTNDYHQLVFRLNENFLANWTDIYEYGHFFYLLYLWIAILIVSFIMIAFYKCQIGESRRLIYVPVIPVISGAVYLILNAMGWIPHINNRLPLAFPDVFCCMIAFAWVGSIATGLVPANKAYTEIFGISSVRAMVLDAKENVIYRSIIAEDRNTDNEVQYELRKEPIRGGYVMWQSDIGELNRINEELTAVRSQLREENQILRLENEIKETQAQIQTKNAVYDAIAVRVLPQSEKITLLSSVLEADAEKQSRNLYLICIYGCYIKRISNLMLIAAQQNSFTAMELALAIAESLNNLNKLHIATNIYLDEEAESFPSRKIVRSYEIFENYIEQTLDCLSGVYVTLKNGVCKLTMECTEPVNVMEIRGSALECDEETCFISIPLEDKEVLS